MRALFRRAPRGRCPECGRNVKLTTTGRLTRHNSTALGDRVLYCSGWAGWPLSDTDRHNPTRSGGAR